MNVEQIDAQANEISALLRTKLSVRGATLAAQSKRIGRLLPKRLKSDVVFMAQAHELVQNPKLMKMVDETRANSAYQALVSHLNDVDPNDRRKGAVLGALGGLVFNLLIVFVIVVTVLWWRGHV